MSEQLYRQNREFPFSDGGGEFSLNDAFRTAAHFLWAKGRIPTAEEIADAMVEVLVSVEPDHEIAVELSGEIGVTTDPSNDESLAFGIEPGIYKLFKVDAALGLGGDV